MQTHVEFRSGLFPAHESEEHEVNPDRWGKRLAEFLRDRLRAEGFETEEPIAEDWGWVVPIANDRFPLAIECGNYDEYPDGFLCFIEPHKPVIRRLFRKVDTTERVTSLQQAMNKVLSETEGIYGIRWWTHEEFDHPK